MGSGKDKGVGVTCLEWSDVVCVDLGERQGSQGNYVEYLCGYLGRVCILCGRVTGSQCSYFRRGVIESDEQRGSKLTQRTTAFWSHCSLKSLYSGKLKSRELQ